MDVKNCYKGGEEGEGEGQARIKGKKKFPSKVQVFYNNITLGLKSGFTFQKYHHPH